MTGSRTPDAGRGRDRGRGGGRGRAGVVVVGRVPTPSNALGAPKFVEETATAGLVHTTTAGRRSRRAAGWPSWTATRMVARTCTWPVAPTPRSCSATAATWGRAGVHAGCDEVTGATGVTGAYPLDVDADGHTDLAVLRVGETLMLRGLGDCRFERANEALGARAAALCVDDRILGGLGGGSDAADPRHRQLPRARSLG